MLRRSIVFLLGGAAIVTQALLNVLNWLLAALSPLSAKPVLILYNDLGEFWLVDTPLMLLSSAFALLYFLDTARGYVR